MNAELQKTIHQFTGTFIASVKNESGECMMKQHCSMSACDEDVFAACHITSCQEFLCYDHFTDILPTRHQDVCKGAGAGLAC